MLSYGALHGKRRRAQNHRIVEIILLLGKAFRASRNPLVFQRIHRFTIQAIGVAGDDFNIPPVPFLPFQVGEVSPGRAFEQRGAVFIDAV